MGLTPVIVKMVWADAIAASNKNEVSKVRFFLCGGLMGKVIEILSLTKINY
jgi:hypothetical protein